MRSGRGPSEICCFQANNALHCPAVFYIIEQMRKKGLR